VRRAVAAQRRDDCRVRPAQELADICWDRRLRHLPVSDHEGAGIYPVAAVVGIFARAEL
jgi:hypothetical protein